MPYCFTLSMRKYAQLLEYAMAQNTHQNIIITNNVM